MTRIGRVGADGEGADDLFTIGNLFAEDTGLPVTVWVSPRGNARHAARVKVCRIAGNRMVPSNTAVVAVAPEPRLIEGTLPARYLAPVAHWVALNAEPLLRYWNGDIGTGGPLRELRRLDEQDVSGAEAKRYALSRRHSVARWANGRPSSVAPWRAGFLGYRRGGGGPPLRCEQHRQCLNHVAMADGASRLSKNRITFTFLENDTEEISVLVVPNPSECQFLPSLFAYPSYVCWAPAPARTSTVPTKRPHGRAYARESGEPSVQTWNFGVGLHGSHAFAARQKFKMFASATLRKIERREGRNRHRGNRSRDMRRVGVAWLIESKS